jgi:phosphohistidine phosphatase
MRLLTVVRHAKSSWQDPELSDFDRPLNDRGRRDAPRMAAWTRQAAGVPDRMLSSPALRVLSTARVFAEILGTEPDQLRTMAQLYEASLATLMQLLQGLDQADRHVMLFGHNPGLSELVHALAMCPFEALPTGAVVHLELQVKRWDAVSEGSGELLSFMFPKRLPDL